MRAACESSPSDSSGRRTLRSRQTRAQSRSQRSAGRSRGSHDLSRLQLPPLESWGEKVDDEEGRDVRYPSYEEHRRVVAAVATEHPTRGALEQHAADRAEESADADDR